jgi:predicted RNA-binding Zn-ribbon protein involved in translation (DUF1610 family)
MNCPNCGTPMNRHAEKLLYDAELEEAVATIFCCPGCGKVEAES